MCVLGVCVGGGGGGGGGGGVGGNIFSTSFHKRMLCPSSELPQRVGSNAGKYVFKKYKKKK